MRHIATKNQTGDQIMHLPPSSSVILKNMRRFALFLLILLGTQVATAFNSAPAKAISLIRDAEIERILRGYATPIFAAAGLNPKAVNIYLVRDNNINAFVAGGQNVFFTTELLLKFDSPAEIKGVIAHEVGHIAGGHLARTRDALTGASATSIASFILGVGAAIAGQPDLGVGILAGGSHVAQRNFLTYSRTQEASADQAALSYLEIIGESGQGLIEVLQSFGNQEALNVKNQDPFVRSHPLSRDRIGAIERRVKASPFYDKAEPPAAVAAHLRMQGKLYGFVKRPDQTLRKFPPSDTSLKARYARAAAYHINSNEAAAHREIAALIADDPDNPYYHELQGQIYFEHGHVDKAIAPYAKSVELAPEEPLLRVNLAQAMLAGENPEYNAVALENLEWAMRQDPEILIGWHQLAIAYARDNQNGMASLASAERYSRAGARQEAVLHAKRALNYLPEGSPGWLRAQDIIETGKPNGKRRG